MRILILIIIDRSGRRDRFKLRQTLQHFILFQLFDTDNLFDVGRLHYGRLDFADIHQLMEMLLVLLGELCVIDLILTKLELLDR